MKGEIKLYIGGMNVDLTNDIDVLFTYSVDTITNPTVVRNSFSRTITIEDTPTNSKVFGQFWNLERIQVLEGDNGTTFNPSKRVPFTIYVNGDIYQEGYCKLTGVKRNGKNNTYDLVLFGGLGSFLYSLHTKDENSDDKKKLSDLHFMTWDTETPSENEFNFTINKETVKDAWDNVKASESSIWHHINFAPCYDGLPSDFDADKVLVNFGTADTSTSGSTSSGGRRPGVAGRSGQMAIVTSTTEGTYSTFDGYALATLPKSHTGDEMREFRSYLMRPVLRCASVINACCAPENNGGYEVALDNSFFNVNNPFYFDSYVTLPQLTTLDFGGIDGDEQTGVTATIGTTTTGGTRTGQMYKETTEITIGTITADTSFNFGMNVDLQAIMNSLPSQVTTSGTLAPCAYSVASSTYYPGTICVQLVAYSKDGRVINGSEIFNCTTNYGIRRIDSWNTSANVPTPDKFTAYTPDFNSTYTTKNGSFTYVSGSTWQMTSTLPFKLTKLPKTCTLKLIITKLNQTSYGYTDKAMCMFQSYIGSDNRIYFRNPATINHFGLKLSNIEISLTNTDQQIRTGAKFTKANLLNTDYTPCDFLLSYCKLFGLYLEKDKYEDKIYIRSRSSYYRPGNIRDLSKNIDASQEMNITPMVFDSKWYNWKLESEDSVFGKQYEDTYGQPYGIQRVNTGYDFDASEKDLYQGNIFHSGIECLEKSDMFSYVSADTVSKPWMFDGFTYNLYNTTDLEDMVELTMPVMSKKGYLTSFSKNKYYDLFTKMQFHGDDNNPSDGSMVLCFFNRMVPTKTLDTNKDLNYFITDDNSYMGTLNDGNPCWLYTIDENDKQGTKIAIKVTSIPQFSRYLCPSGNGNVTQSWDFGYPKQIFIPDYTMDYAMPIYNNYWKSYITDLYDIDTKKLSCYVKLDDRPAEDWLRDFYWFNNSIWRINKIEDYNVLNTKSTKIEFIKVQDISNYSNVNVSSIPTVTLSASTTSVPNSGATVTIYVTVSDGGKWFVSDYTYDVLNASVSSGSGNGSFTVQIPANTDTENKVYRISVENDYDQWGWVEIEQVDAILTVTPFGPYTNDDIPWTGDSCMYTVKATYPWTVTLDRNYASISPGSGSGNTTYGETVTLTFDQSDSLAPRNVKMVFEDSHGNSVTVYKWQDQCINLVYDYTGGTKTIDYLSGASAVTPTWISVTDNGNNTYDVVADFNPDMNDRTVTLYFSFPDSDESSNIEVLQYSGVVFDVTRLDGTGNVLSSGGSVVLGVTSNGEWTVSSDSAWCVPNLLSASTSATEVVSVSANTSDSGRSATLTFTHTAGTVIDYAIVQDGLAYVPPPEPYIFDVVRINGAGNVLSTGGTIYLDVTATYPWTASTSDGFISLSPTSDTSYNQVVNVVFDENTGETRQATITFVDQTGTTITFTQVQEDIIPEEDFFSVTRIDGTGNIMSSGNTVTMSILSNKPWTATCDSQWCVPSILSASTSATQTLTISSNTGETRVATLTYTQSGGTVITYTVTQEGYGTGPSWVTPGFISFSASGGTAETQTLTVNTPNNWNVVAHPDWISYSPTSGSGVTTVSVTAIPYSGASARTGYMVFYNTVTTATALVMVNQAAADGEILAVSPSSINFNSAGGTAQLTIIANTDWTIA